MKRRRFLQLTVSAAAGALVRHASALSFAEGQTFQPAAADVLSLTVGEPPLSAFDTVHAGFGASRRSTVEPDQMIELLLEKRSDGIYQWTIDGQSQSAEALFLEQGRRYRLRMMNATGGVHTVHLRHHSFELTRIHQVPVSGIFRNTLRLGRYNVVEADVLMSRSGPLLLRYPSR
jgi:FtsP/CotA-like multicopper oxidase with cupredoxin domain